MAKPQHLTDRIKLHNHFVYFNLHKRRWSLKASWTDQLPRRHPTIKGRVTGHADTVILFNTITKVSEAGRQRVIREKRKNVHAGIIGSELVVNPSGTLVTSDRTPGIRYNPYELPYFHDRTDKLEVRNPPVVVLGTKTLDSGVRVPTAYYGEYLYTVGEGHYFISGDDFNDYILDNQWSGLAFRSDGKIYTVNAGFIERSRNPLSMSNLESEKLSRF